MKLRLVSVAVVLAGLATGVLAWEQRRRVSAPADVSEKPANYSPLGFMDLLEYQQAYPGEPGSAEVATASAAKYWVFQGVAVRGAGPGTIGAWLSLGPDTVLASSSAAEEETVSGRVSALLVSPTCGLIGRCRVWVGTAGGGIWRTEDGLTRTDPKWR